MDHGTYVPVLAYLVSCLGCGLGLVCTNRAWIGTHASRNMWLAWAAVSIGGTGIWGMHFTAMLGTTVEDSAVTWDVLLTILSLVIAIMIVAFGVLIVSYGAQRLPTLLLAGLFTGIGVAAMHYVGMAAMQVQGRLHYHLPLVALSVLIAVVAATAALWITREVRSRLAMGGAVAIMGLAVSGMHYTGMAAAGVTPDPGAPVPTGASAAFLIWPLAIWIAGCPLVTFLLVALAPSGQEILDNKHYQEIAHQLSQK